MKHLFFLLLFSMTAVLSAAAKPATTTAKPAETKPAATTAKPAATPAKPAETKPAATAAKPAETKPAATAAKPAATPATTKPATAKPPVTVLTSIYSPDRNPSEFADREKAEDLLNRRAELVKKIQDERKRLLKEDNTARNLNEEIMLLNRKLASLLETKKSMIELNSELRDLDNAISRLKPAPPPEPETKPETKTEDDGKKAEKE